MQATALQETNNRATVTPSSRDVLRSEHGITLFRGGQLQRFDVAYETWGTLSPAKDNCILLLTGLSPSAHAKSSHQDATRGWWEKMIGPGCALDTTRFFVICVNNLGSCFGTTGPASVHRESGRPYGLDFPELSMEDLAQVAHRVVLSFGVDRLHALLGPSMGGFTALAYALQFPDTVGRISLISSALRPQARAIAVHSLQREAITNDPAWCNGLYTPEHRPTVGMRLARKIGMTSYRSAAEWEHRFGNSRTEFKSTSAFGVEFQVEAYLEATSKRFVDNFDPNCYLYLSRAMDIFDILSHGATAVSTLAGIKTKAIQVIGVESDNLFPLHQQNQLAETLEEADQAVQFVVIDSDKGHDAFLVETDRFAPVISEFLS
jgi:homoserine O-acetyltransferase